jgi:hypothetical protein
MATDDTIPGNRSTRSLIGNVSFAIVIAFFILCAVLTLDAYKFISFRVRARRSLEHKNILFRDMIHNKTPNALVKHCIFFDNLLIPPSSLFLHCASICKKQQAKFARKRLISALAYMPPETIESHTGMKVLTNDQYTTFMNKLESGRKGISELHRNEGNQITELNKVKSDTATMKADIELLKAFVAKSTTNTTDTK